MENHIQLPEGAHELHLKTESINSVTERADYSKNMTLPGFLSYIGTMSKDINARQAEHRDCLVTVDVNNGRVNLREGVHNRFTTDNKVLLPFRDINGSITLHEDFTMLREKCKNTSLSTPRALGDWVRANKRLFTDTAQWNKLHTGLREFEAKVNTSIASIAHDRGLMKEKLEKEVDSAPFINEVFKVAVRVINGGEIEHFEIYIAYDPSQGNQVMAGIRNWDLEMKAESIVLKGIEAAEKTIKETLTGTPVCRI
jgi:hypothetical protein